MSKDTWDFQCWQDRDLGPGAARGEDGCSFSVSGQALPFSNALSGVISFYILGGYTYTISDPASQPAQWLHSISYRTAGTNNDAFMIKVFNEPSGTGYVQFRFYDDSAGVLRYQYNIGDEDGINGLQENKFYQVAFSADATSFQYVMNGSTTPLIVGTPTSNPGALNISLNTERWWFSGGASSGFFDPHDISSGYSSLLRGPAAFEGSALDLSDAAVRDRIFDAEGNLKHPGENGSLWWNDDYTDTAGFKPDVYLPDGAGRLEKGSAGLTFVVENGSGSGMSDVPGGLRKFYE